MALTLTNDYSAAEMMGLSIYIAAGGPLTGASPHFSFAEVAKQTGGRLDLKPEIDALFRREWDNYRPERDWMRSAVELVMHDPATARVKLRKEIEEGASQVLVSPAIRWNGRAFATELNYFALSIPALMGYAIGLLLDEDRGLAVALKRCALCQRIFLSVPSAKGGRPPLYCTRDHQDIVARASGAERTAKWRKSKAKKAK